MKIRDILGVIIFVITISGIILLFYAADFEVINYLRREFFSFAISVFALVLFLTYLFYSFILSGKEKSKISKEKEKEILILKANEKYRKEFFGNVSHELKTPLFNIQGYVATLLDNEIEDDKTKLKFLKRTDRNINRLITIVNDLEMISNIESGQLDLEYTEFNIANLISEVMEMHEPEALNRMIHLEFPHRGSKLVVRADRDRIQTVLSNLLSNAINYGNEGGMAKVVLKEKEKTVGVYVMDDGIGISPEDSKRVFERFYRVDKSRSKEYGGSGLGLSIVKHLLERHGKSINLRSEKDYGCKFFFDLDKVELGNS